jgi:hypothetical protein
MDVARGVRHFYGVAVIDRLDGCPVVDAGGGVGKRDSQPHRAAKAGTRQTSKITLFGFSRNIQNGVAFPRCGND